ncbi:MAG: protease pro-enzyme activation domain-containing protein [Vulcanimicrobiaceae bacterium]
MGIDKRLSWALGFLVVAATACGGGSKSAAPFVPGGAPGATGPASFAYDAEFVNKSQLLKPATFGRMAFDVALRMQDAKGLAAYAVSVNNPSSPNYRQFLTPSQIADRFSATQGDSNAAVAYFKAQGLSVLGWRQRLLLQVEGTQAQLERAFDTKFGVFQNGSEVFLAPMTAPHLPGNVPVVGSPNIVLRPKRYFVSSLTHPGTGSQGGGYSPQQLAAAFDYNGAYAAGFTGSGITLGIIGTGPVSTQTSTRLGDLEAFKSLYGVSGSSSLSVVSTSSSDPAVNGASGFASPPPVTAACTTAGNPAYNPSTSPSANCDPEDGEAQIDTEQAASLARDSKIEFYLAYNPNDGCLNVGGNPIEGQPCPPGAGFPEQGLVLSDDELQTAIDHDTADVLSLSYGGAEFGSVAPPGGTSPPNEFTTDGQGLDPTEFAMLAAEGIAVFAGSGDSGAEFCQAEYPYPPFLNSTCVSYPATDPNVVAVGGVTTPLDSAGNFVGPVTAWGLQTSAGSGGSGGGISSYFPLPSYQQSVPGVQTAFRNVPDISLEADSATGVAVIVDADSTLGGGARSPIPFGGTSVATPEAAAMWALVLEACKATPACARAAGPKPYRLGNPNPLFYKIYQSSAYPDTFLDVTYGNNAQLPYCQNIPPGSDPTNCPSPAPSPAATGYDPGYSAGVGYDQVTGIGVPFARNLIRAVAGI